jgi:hypothetical protein
MRTRDARKDMSPAVSTAINTAVKSLGRMDAKGLMGTPVPSVEAEKTRQMANLRQKALQFLIEADGQGLDKDSLEFSLKMEEFMTREHAKAAAVIGEVIKHGEREGAAPVPQEMRDATAAPSEVRQREPEPQPAEPVVQSLESSQDTGPLQMSPNLYSRVLQAWAANDPAFRDEVLAKYGPEVVDQLDNETQ